jgi:hypothetical protein
MVRIVGSLYSSSLRNNVFCWVENIQANPLKSASLKQNLSIIESGFDDDIIFICL